MKLRLPPRPRFQKTTTRRNLRACGLALLLVSSFSFSSHRASTTRAAEATDEFNHPDPRGGWSVGERGQDFAIYQKVTAFTNELGRTTFARFDQPKPNSIGGRSALFGPGQRSEF